MELLGLRARPGGDQLLHLHRNHRCCVQLDRHHLERQLDQRRGGYHGELHSIGDARPGHRVRIRGVLLSPLTGTAVTTTANRAILGQPALTTTSLTVMGTSADISVWGGRSDLAAYAADRLRDLERRWSRFDPRSEVSKVNAMSGDGAVVVSEDTVLLLAKVVEGWTNSGGLFDPTVLPSMIALGYDRTFTTIEPLDAAADTLGRSPGCGSIRVDRGLRAVALPAGVSVDPGGIGKGLAADLVVGELLDRGALGACVSVGGDVRAAHGPSGAIPWRIGLADPSDPTHLFAVASIASGAVVTSSTLTRRWPLGAGIVHHLIDPRTGAPTRSDLVAVTVVAGEAWWAEVLAKWVLMAGEQAGTEVLERHGATGLLVRSDRTAVMLGGMRRFVSEPQV